MRLAGFPWELRVLIGWLVFAASYLIMAWRLIYAVDGEWIRGLVRQEDNGRRASGVIATVTSLVSLAGVMFALSRASGLKDQALLEGLLIGAALLSVALSWLLIQTIYTFRYAHLYYESPEGGVKFPATPEPDYLDFAYLAFTIGMTYQVSDTDLDQRPMRRLLDRPRADFLRLRRGHHRAGDQCRQQLAVVRTCPRFVRGMSAHAGLVQHFRL